MYDLLQRGDRIREGQDRFGKRQNVILLALEDVLRARGASLCLHLDIEGAGELGNRARLVVRILTLAHVAGEK